MASSTAPIYTKIVDSGETGIITFNNIPQTFTDLLILFSARTNYNGFADAYMFFQDGAGTNTYSTTAVRSDASYRYTNNGTMNAFGVNGSNTVANLFASGKIYIPNYRSTASFKQVFSEFNMGITTQYQSPSFNASLWRNTSAITQISFAVANGFAQYTKFSLYGIKKFGA